jgi:hypothetical protein
VKEIRTIDSQLDKADLKLKIADLTEALSEAKLGIVDVADQIQKKDEEIARLNALLVFKADNLVSKGAFRYFADSDGKASGVPICPVCERKGLFLKLAQDRSKGAGSATYVCPSCKANYGYGGVVAK